MSWKHKNIFLTIFHFVVYFWSLCPLNAIYNVKDAQIEVLKSVWTLASGAHASPAGVSPFLVVAHCCSQAAAGKSVPCTANSFPTRQIDLLWLAAKNSMVKTAVHYNSSCDPTHQWETYASPLMILYLKSLLWRTFCSPCCKSDTKYLCLCTNIADTLRMPTNFNSSRRLCVSTQRK